MINLDQYKTRLVEIMEEISSECYCATWMHNVEFHAYLAMNNGCRYFGRSEISEDQCEELRELWLKSGLWPTLDNENKVIFVTAHNFRKLFNLWMQHYFLPNKEVLIKPPRRFQHG